MLAQINILNFDLVHVVILYCDCHYENMQNVFTFFACMLIINEHTCQQLLDIQLRLCLRNIFA